MPKLSASCGEFTAPSVLSVFFFFYSGKEEQKSRKEKRKEARSEKHKQRFLSWVQHQVNPSKSFKRSTQKDESVVLVASVFKF